MQFYQLDLLDEKALVILKGLEQLRIISLRPLPAETITPGYVAVSKLNDRVEDPPQTSWKDSKGAVTSKRPLPESSAVEEPAKEINENNLADDDAPHPLWKFKGMWNLDMTLDEIDAEVDNMREGWR